MVGPPHRGHLHLPDAGGYPLPGEGFTNNVWYPNNVYSTATQSGLRKGTGVSIFFIFKQLFFLFLFFQIPSHVRAGKTVPVLSRASLSVDETFADADYTLFVALDCDLQPRY